MVLRKMAVLAASWLLCWSVGCGSDSEGGEGNGGGPQTQSLPEIEVSPTALTFSALPPGQSETLSLKVSNTGAGDDLEIRDVYIMDKTAPYTFTGPGVEVLAEGDSATIEVTFTAGIGAAPATALVIESNASTKPKLSVPLSVAAEGSGLTIYPDPIDFKEVLGGDTKVLHVTIANMNPTETTIVNTFLQPDSSEDFEIFDPPEYPADIDPHANLVVDLAYTPTGSGVDHGVFVVAYNAGGAQALAKIPVSGVEVGPEINITPPKLEFGYVAVGDTATLTFDVFNMGQHDLKISKVYVAALSNEDLAVDDAPTSTVVLASGQKATFTVSFEPTKYFETTMDPIGGIAVESNDGDEAIVNVPVYGNIDAPFIRLDPPEEVNFGIVAKGWTIERKLTIEDVGHAPLVVEKLEISANTQGSEFAIIADDAFPPTTGAGPGNVVPDAPQQVTLSFTNNGGPLALVLGKLHILSNDPLTPDVYVDLVAERGDLPVCKLSFVPAKLDFGTVAHGAKKTDTMFLKNAGSGYCSFDKGMVRDCGSFMGMMASCSDNAGPSPYFKPLSMPPAVLNGIGPGTSHPIQINYVPPTSVPWIPIFEDYYGVLEVFYNEQYTAPGVNTKHSIPAAANGTLPWNLHGKSGVADIAVLPPEIEFGLVTIGCYSQTVCVRIYNAGTAPLQVTDVYLEGCGVPSEFQLKDFPELPIEIGESKYEEACAVYLPQNEGLDGCHMVIESSDLDTPVFHVPLKGEGTWETEHTDIYTQISGKKVDILIVVDGSPSMCGEIDNVAENFDALTAIAAQWGNDYQIGITSLDLENAESCDPSKDSCPGALVGSPRILTKATVGSFGANVEAIGCSTSSGGQEAGLEAGRQALVPPFGKDTDVACNCAEDKPCPGVCAEGELCVKGKCGGWNRGLIRKDAALEVVFLSDEEDQSPGSVPFYIDFYKSIKGFLNADMFHAHAIVGDPGGGCNSGGQSDGADAGDRYVEVQEATGGVFGSICDDSFHQVLEDIGNKAFGLQVQFFLSAQADSTPGSVKVWVNGEPCNSGWSYDPATNSVVFDEAGPCMPQAGDEIKIWYKMVCNAQ